MRRFLLLAVIFLVLVVVAAVAIPFLIPVEEYKGLIISKTKEATGRDLKINGKISFSIFPNVALILRDVEFSNPEGSDVKNMFAAKEAEAVLKLVPLLKKNIQVEKFIIDSPVINLAKDKNGKPNWEFEQPAETAKEKQTAEESGFDPAKISLGVLKIKNGEVNYYDAPKAKPVSVKALNLDVKTENFDKPINITSEGSIDGKKFKFDVETISLNQLRAKQDGNLKINGEYASAKMEYLGKFSNKNAIALDGNIKFDTKNLSELTNNNAINLLNLTSAISLSNKDGKTLASLKNTKIIADDIMADGNINVGYAAGLSSIAASLNIDKIDINKFTKNTDSEVVEKAGASSDFTWSDEKIDFSAFKKINADLDLKIKELVIKKAILKPVAISLKINAGKLSGILQEIKLYGGSMNASFDVNASGEKLMFRKSANISNIRTDEFLRDFASFDKISGKGNLKINISGTGNSQREIISNLNGAAEILIADGSFKGVDLVGMVRNIQSAFITTDASSKKTDFSEVSGSFNINSGIVSNNNLVMKAPLIRLSGEGQVDLPRLTVNYRVNPELVPSLEGQGAENNVAGFKVPVKIEGPLLNPQFRPDLTRMLQNELQNPGQFRDNIKQLKRDSKGLLNDLLGKKKPVPESAPAPVGNQGAEVILNNNRLKDLIPALKGPMEQAPQNIPQATPQPVTPVVPPAVEPAPAVAPQPEPSRVPNPAQ